MQFSRQEYCSGLPFPTPGDLPDSGIKPASLHLPHWQADYHWATWENHKKLEGKTTLYATKLSLRANTTINKFSALYTYIWICMQIHLGMIQSWTNLMWQELKPFGHWEIVLCKFMDNTSSPMLSNMLISQLHHVPWNLDLSLNCLFHLSSEIFKGCFKFLTALPYLPICSSPISVNTSITYPLLRPNT